MKRLNSATGKPFKYGDVRDDGYVFWGYNTNNIRSNGFFDEGWRSPDKFENQRTKAAAGKRQARTTLHGRMKALEYSTKQGSKRRGHDASEIDVQFLKDLWIQQGGKCAYTGWDMSLETNTEDLVSIERKDNSIGYTRNNVLLVCWCANRARREMTQDKFFTMCAAIARQSEKKWPE